MKIKEQFREIYNAKLAFDLSTNCKCLASHIPKI